MRLSYKLILKSYAFFILGITFSVQAGVTQPKTGQLTPEQQARLTEADLRATELKINSECQPKSVATKLYLKTLSENGVKYFWLGQRYAVQRTYQEWKESDRIRAINRSADERIAAIENQRDLAVLSAAGIRQYEDPATNRVIAENERALSSMEKDWAKSNYEWAKKCYKYADERSK